MIAVETETGRFPSVSLLGIRINAIRLPELLGAVSTAVSQSRRITVLYVNVHCMNVAADDARYAAILDGADIVYCDGTGVRLGAALAGFRIPQRMTGADWIDDLCRLAIRLDHSLFLIGGETGVAEEAGAVLRQRYPNLRIHGTGSGFESGAEVIQRIKAVHPDIVLVGMGTPRQEKWIDAYRAELDAPVVWAVGALFDFVSGRIPRGPSWMTEHGLEWLCRLAVEPRKLWRRYLLGNPRFLWRVVRARWF